MTPCLPQAMAPSLALTPWPPLFQSGAKGARHEAPCEVYDCVPGTPRNGAITPAERDAFELYLQLHESRLSGKPPEVGLA